MHLLRSSLPTRKKTDKNETKKKRKVTLTECNAVVVETHPRAVGTAYHLNRSIFRVIGKVAFVPYDAPIGCGGGVVGRGVGSSGHRSAVCGHTGVQVSVVFVAEVVCVCVCE